MDHLAPGVSWFPSCNTFGELLGGVPHLPPVELGGVDAAGRQFVPQPQYAPPLPLQSEGAHYAGGAREEEEEAAAATPPPDGRARARPPGEKIACRECGATFACGANLRNHLRIHTGERPYACEECGASFTQRSNLRSHKRVHTGERPYMCGICGQTFARSSHLPGHMRTHTGEKPFECPRCGRSFATNQIMKNHVRTHTGERPFACGACGATFAQSSCLATHRKIHTGERNFGCSRCGKAFISRSGLQTHERVHTGEKPYACDRCGKSFKTSSYLSKHRQKYCGNDGYRNRRARRPDAKKPGRKARGTPPKRVGAERPRRSRRRRNGETPVEGAASGPDCGRAKRRTRRGGDGDLEGGAQALVGGATPEADQARVKWEESVGPECPGQLGPRPDENPLEGEGPSVDVGEAEADPEDPGCFGDSEGYVSESPRGAVEAPRVAGDVAGEPLADAHRQISEVLRQVSGMSSEEQLDSYVPRNGSWYS